MTKLPSFTHKDTPTLSRSIFYKYLLITAFLVLSTVPGWSQPQRAAYYGSGEREQFRRQLAREMRAHYEILDNRPLYELDTYSSRCRLVIKVNDIHLGRYLTKAEDGGLFFINPYLFSSGPQRITVESFPISPDRLHDGAEYRILLYRYASNEDWLKGIRDTIVQTGIIWPGDLWSKKCPSHTDSMTFTAELPYDYSALLSQAKDLRTVPGIKSLVRTEYKRLWRALKDQDSAYFLHSESEKWPYLAMLYATEADCAVYLSSRCDRLISPTYDYRKVPRLGACETIFCADGKFVLLLQKKTKNKPLRVEFYADNKQTAQETAYLFAVFYMPEGSDRLVRFY